ncbi:MAG: DNA internalization-related competence protein ComEC/Rec2 [Balneolaceae bacterium]
MSHQQQYLFPFPAMPALRLFVLFAVGILIASLLQRDAFYPYLIASILLFISWMTIEYIQKRKVLLWGSFLATIFYLLFVSLFGAFWYSLDQQKRDVKEESAHPISLYEWETVTIKGTVLESGWSQSGRENYTIKTAEILLPDGVNWHHEMKMRVYGNEENQTEIIAGREIKADIRLYSFPEKRNPHEFDYGTWLKEQSIFGHGELEELHQTERKTTLSWGPVQEYVRGNVDMLFDEETAPLAKALFLGYKQELTLDHRQAFSRSGLSHIMAVSGLHVGFIVAPFWLIIPWLWGSKKTKWLGLFALTILLVGYAGITGFSASVSRASLMAWLLTYGKLFHKIRNSINLLAFAGIVLLLINPRQLFDVGFQLSFSAVFIILMVMPEAQRLIPERFRFNWKGSFLTIILISFIVQLGLFPILTYYFGEFSIIGPLANALVLPLLAVTVPVGLIISLIGGIFESGMQMISVPVALSIQWIDGVANQLGSFDYGYLTLGHKSIFIYAVWAFFVAGIATIRIPAIRWKMGICFLISFNLFLIESHLKNPSVHEMEVTVLDVSQGDAVHIKTPLGKHVLVDAGRWSPMGNSGEQVLIPYFDYLGVDHIDAVILSHPHADHIGGLPALMESISIGKIYHSEYSYDSKLYERYNEMADEKSIPVFDVKSGDQMEIDPAVRFFVIGPNPNSGIDRNPNNHSLAFRLQYGNTSFLFTGDAETEQENKMVKQYGDFLDTDFLKAGHHGSKTSSTKKFVETVTPKITAFSLALQNQFGHPGNKAVANVFRSGSESHYTSLHGALRYISDGEVIERN